jgi:hypothetical protein
MIYKERERERERERKRKREGDKEEKMRRKDEPYFFLEELKYCSNVLEAKLSILPLGFFFLSMASTSDVAVF